MEVVYLGFIMDKLGTNKWRYLKISQLTMVPHKSHKFWSIIDLLFSLKIFDMEVPSVNDANVVIAPSNSMNQLGSVLPRIIEKNAYTSNNRCDILFTKLNIKEGYW